MSKPKDLYLCMAAELRPRGEAGKLPGFLMLLDNPEVP